MLDRVSLRAVRGAERPHVGDRPLRVDPDPEALGEPQIVLHQRVLGPVAAADHALPAADTAGPGRTVPVEIRVGVLNAGLAEIDPHARMAIGLLDAQRGGQLAQQDVAVGVKRHVGDAEHPLRGLVVRVQLGLPVSQLAPPRILKERVAGAVQRVRVAQAAAADTRARRDQNVRERRQPHDPAQPQPRREKVPPRVPRAAREILI